MPESDLLTKLQDLDEKILKVIADQKQEVRFTMKAAEFVKKRLRIFIQSEHHSQTSGAEHGTRFILKHGNEINGFLLNSSNQPMRMLCMHWAAKSVNIYQ